MNYAGHLNEALYAKSFTGTKQLIEEYCGSSIWAPKGCDIAGDTVVDCLEALRREALAVGESLFASPGGDAW